MMSFRLPEGGRTHRRDYILNTLEHIVQNAKEEDPLVGYLLDMAILALREDNEPLQSASIPTVARGRTSPPARFT
jgi:hypothetical protein